MDRGAVEEIKRHFDVVADGMRSDTRAVAEGVALLAQQHTAMDSRLGGIESRLGGVETRLVAVESRLTSLDARVQREFGETQAMFRLSHSELDHRLRDLEKSR